MVERGEYTTGGTSDLGVRKSKLENGKEKSYRRHEECGRDSLRREREEFTTELAEGPQRQRRIVIS